MSTAAIIAGTAAAGIGGAAIASHGATSAANTQAAAADRAAQLQYNFSEDALNFQKQQYANTQGLIAPWVSAGRSGLANLEYAMGLLNPGGVRTSTPTAVGGFDNVVTRNTNDGSGYGSGIGPDYQPSPAMSGMRPVPGSVAAPGGTPDYTAQLGRDVQPRMMNRINPDFTPEDINSGAVPALDVANAYFNGDSGSPAAPGSSSTNPGAPGSTTATTFDPNALVNPNLTTPGSLLAPWTSTFTAPQLNETTDPGYLARLNLAQDAMQRSAAARGGLLSGGTLRDLNQFTQDYASNEYNNVYNRALNTYDTNYNTFQQNQANLFNRLAAISGIGQTAAQQLSNAGTATAGNVANIDLGAGAQIGANINNEGAARASGYVGSGNAWSGALTGTTNSLTSLYLMSQLLNGGGAGAGTAAGGYPDIQAIGF